MDAYICTFGCMGVCVCVCVSEYASVCGWGVFGVGLPVPGGPARRMTLTGGRVSTLCSWR